jgi:beta-N-acetylhexosaminidase
MNRQKRWILSLFVILSLLITGLILLTYGNRKDNLPASEKGTDASGTMEQVDVTQIPESMKETVGEEDKSEENQEELPAAEQTKTVDKDDSNNASVENNNEEQEGIGEEQNLPSGQEEMDQEENIEENKAEKVDELLNQMTLEEKAAQLFMVTPEAITKVSPTTAAGEATKEALKKYPVGGLIYFSQNLISRDQVSTMIGNAQSYCDIPLFIGVDEEGGSVARVAGKLGTTSFPSMSEIGKSGDLKKAYEVGDTIGKELKQLGFNVDFAPDADVITNPKNKVIGNRSFGTDAKLVSDMVTEVIKGLQDNQISATVKHFPGHGSTEADSHKGYARSYRTLEELRNAEFLPFEAGIEAGVDFVMVGHISTVNITGEDTPSSLSSTIITDILRGDLGYEGIVITDAMNMGAVSNNYSSDQAAVAAIEAGVDIILMPADFEEAYDAVLTAIEDKKITMERIDESVRRILRIKIKRGIIK